MKNPLESKLQTDLLLAAPRELPDLRLFRRNVGGGQFVDYAGHARAVQFGIAGQSDLFGYWKGGCVTEIELKSATGTLSPEQKQWQAFCLAWGVPHVVLKAKKNETIGDTIVRWCSELREVMPK